MAATVEYEIPDTTSVLYHLVLMAHVSPCLFLRASRMIVTDLMSMVASQMLGEDVHVVLA